MRVYNLLASEYAISNIALKRLKVSRYGELNDPFELMAGEVSDHRFRQAVNKWKTDFHAKKGIICFSRNWHNPVLWSHYGDRHRGIALGFDISDEYASPIEYSDSRLIVKFENGNPDAGLDKSYVRKLIHTKFVHWQYEEEVRFHVGLDESTEEGGLYFFDFGPNLILREVILGHSCVVPIQLVRDLVACNHKNVNVVKARLAFKEFRVVTD